MRSRLVRGFVPSLSGEVTSVINGHRSGDINWILGEDKCGKVGLSAKDDVEIGP